MPRNYEPKTDAKVYRSTIDKFPQETNQCGTEMEAPFEPLSLADSLRAKRARISQRASVRVKKLDRQITLLDQSNAESILADAQAALHEDE